MMMIYIKITCHIGTALVIRVQIPDSLTPSIINSYTRAFYHLIVLQELHLELRLHVVPFLIEITRMTLSRRW